MKQHHLHMIGTDEVLAVLNVSRTTLWRYIRTGKFPAPVKIGPTMRWQKRVFDEWLTDRGADISDWEVRRRRDIDELC